MLKKLIFSALVAFVLWLPLPAMAQFQTGLPMQALGVCQIAAGGLNSQVNLSACVGASFTATCSGTAGTTITASAVTGDINVGWPLSGTGITSGTYVASFGTGTGGAGTYVASQACTSSGASLTTIGPPNNATAVLLQAETQNVRWRDDGGAPTAAVGMLMTTTAAPLMYSGPVANIRVISATAGAVLDAAFYKSSSP
jgi:hypothetical protein